MMSSDRPKRNCPSTSYKQPKSYHNYREQSAEMSDSENENSTSINTSIGSEVTINTEQIRVNDFKVTLTPARINITPAPNSMPTPSPQSTQIPELREWDDSLYIGQTTSFPLGKNSAEDESFSPAPIPPTTEIVQIISTLINNFQQTTEKIISKQQQQQEQQQQQLEQFKKEHQKH